MPIPRERHRRSGFLAGGGVAAAGARTDDGNHRKGRRGSIERHENGIAYVKRWTIHKLMD